MGLLEAAKQIVQRWDSPDWKDQKHTADYIHELRQAIAQAERQEPELDLEIFCDPSYFDMWCVRDPVIKDFNHTIHVNSKEHALHAKAVIEDWVKRYTAPPQREWVEPSDEQIAKVRDDVWCVENSLRDFARAVLKLAKEINNR